MGRRSYRKSRKYRRKRRYRRKSSKIIGVSTKIHRMRYQPTTIHGLGDMTSRQIAKFARKVFVNPKAKAYFELCARAMSGPDKHNWSCFIHSVPLKRRLIVAGWVLGDAEKMETYDTMDPATKEGTLGFVIKGIANYHRFLLDQCDPIKVRAYRLHRKVQADQWKTVHRSLIAAAMSAGN